MDFLNKAYAQLVELFRSMTPGARIASALLLVVAVVSVAFLYNQQVSGPDTYLMGGEMFSPSQLRDMQAAFGKAGLEAQLDGARVKVPSGQQSKYMAALAEANALPAEFGEFLAKAVNTNSFFSPNRLQQETQIKIARQRELQGIINSMSGVDKCAVQIDEEVKRDLFARKVITASVSIQPKGLQPVSADLVLVVKNLVAGSVAGLNPDAVTVIDLRNARSFAGNGGRDSKSGGAMGDYADYKKRLQQDWEESIGRVLSYIPGVVITTNVELDPELSNEETATEYEPAHSESRVELGSSAVGDVNTSVQWPKLSRNGEANQSPVVGGTSLPRIGDEPSQKPPRGSMPIMQKRIVREGRTPKRVTVSVAVPNSYYEEVWRRQNPPAEGQTEVRPDPGALAELQAAEKKKIEEIIVTLLPVRDKTLDAFPQVAVSTFYPIRSAPLPELTPQESALAWLGQHWNTLALGGLTLVSLLILRSMVRSIPSAPIPAPMAMDQDRTQPFSLLADDEADESLETSPQGRSAGQGRFKRRAGNQPSLRDELAEIVNDDPEAAVSILRTWIGNAS